MSAVHHDEILRVFRENPPASTRTTAQRCIDAGVFSQEWLESAAIRSAQAAVRKALKTCDIQGLPIAGKTNVVDDNGAPVWVQRELWDYDTYALNIGQYVDQGDANYQKAADLAVECRTKYGRAPRLDGEPSDD